MFTDGDPHTTPHSPRCPTLVGLRARGWLRGVGRCTLAYGDNPDHLCAWCGTQLAGRRRRWCTTECERTFQRNHDWGMARTAALKRDGGCVRCGSSRSLEVNHRTPILGRHGVFGCHHHLDGLSVLCHSCHLVDTAAQRARGWLPVEVPDGGEEALTVVPEEPDAGVAG